MTMDNREAYKKNFQNINDLNYVRDLLIRDKTTDKAIINDIGMPFNTNILRIALNNYETTLAQIMVIDF